MDKEEKGNEENAGKKIKKGKSEFEIARRKRKAKIVAGRTAKFIGAVLILGIVCVSVYLFVSNDIAGIISDRIAVGSAAGASMPVDMNGESVTQTFYCGEAIGVLSDITVNLYAENGKQLLSYRHDMVDPVVETAGRRFLIYDHSGTKLIVRTRDSVLFEKEFNYSIISANLSADGWLSVVTNAQRYTSQLHVWDSTYENEIFTWSSADEYIICAAADAETKVIAAATLSADSYGDILTNIHTFFAESGNRIVSHTLKGQAVIDIAFNDKGEIKTICDSMAVLLTKTGDTVGSVLYSEPPVSVINVPGSPNSALIFDNFTKTRTVAVKFLDENFKEGKEVSLKGKYVCSNGNENNVAVYCSGIANIFNYSGKRTAELDSEQDALKIQLTKENLYAVTRSDLCQIK